VSVVSAPEDATATVVRATATVVAATAIAVAAVETVVTADGTGIGALVEIPRGTSK